MRLLLSSHHMSYNVAKRLMRSTSVIHISKEQITNRIPEIVLWDNVVRFPGIQKVHVAQISLSSIELYEHSASTKCMCRLDLDTSDDHNVTVDHIIESNATSNLSMGEWCVVGYDKVKYPGEINIVGEDKIYYKKHMHKSQSNIICYFTNTYQIDDKKTVYNNKLIFRIRNASLINFEIFTICVLFFDDNK